MNTKEAIERMKRKMGEKAHEPYNRFCEQIPKGFRMDLSEAALRKLRADAKKHERNTDTD